MLFNKHQSRSIWICPEAKCIFYEADFFLASIFAADFFLLAAAFSSAFASFARAAAKTDFFLIAAVFVAFLPDVFFLSATFPPPPQAFRLDSYSFSNTSSTLLPNPVRGPYAVLVLVNANLAAFPWP